MNLGIEHNGSWDDVKTTFYSYHPKYQQHCRSPIERPHNTKLSWICTRIKDHTGPHVAHSGNTKALATWYTES